MRIPSWPVKLIMSDSKKYTESCLMHSNCLYERNYVTFNSAKHRSSTQLLHAGGRPWNNMKEVSVKGTHISTTVHAFE